MSFSLYEPPKSKNRFVYLFLFVPACPVWSHVSAHRDSEQETEILHLTQTRANKDDI